MENWEENARARVKDNYAAENAMALWETLRNPENKVSRAAARECDPNAPAPSATVKAWKEYLCARFPDLPGQFEHKDSQLRADIAARDKAWKAQRLQITATTGPRWNHDGTIYPNALEFVKALTAKGYKPEKTGIGAVRLINPETHIFVGPMRNQHINAAVKLCAGL